MDEKEQIIKSSMFVKILLVFSILVMIFVSGCTTKGDIVGKWSVVTPFSKVAVVEEFYNNGTVVIGGNTPMSQDGTYKFIDDKHLIIEFGGMGAMAGPQNFEVVSLSGTTMVLKDEAGNLYTYTRL